MGYLGAGQRGDFPSIAGSALARGSVRSQGLAPPCPPAIHRPSTPQPHSTISCLASPLLGTGWTPGTVGSTPSKSCCPWLEAQDCLLSAPSPCRASPSSGRCRRVLGASDTILQGGVPSGGSVQPEGGNGPGWECGSLWAPGALSLGDCKIPMYITWLCWTGCSRVQ